jgi:membrane protein YdbS with pleckstrin-like domain
MPFPRRLLTEDEEVIVELRPHWAFLGGPLVIAVVVVALAITAVASFPDAPSGLMYLLLAVVVGSALWLAARLVRWFATSLVVTTSRVVQRSGVLVRNGLELRLERINQLSYHQSILARMLRTGELDVETGVETGVVVFRHVPRPAAVQSVITEQIDAMHRRSEGALIHRPGGVSRDVSRDHDGSLATENPMTDDTPPSGIPLARLQPGGPSVAHRLVQLDELWRRGIVTDAEFASKKAELLDRL